MSEPLEIRVGTNSETYLVLRIIKRAYPGHMDYWDGNWLVSAGEVKVAGFSGQTNGFLRADEIAGFGQQLQHAYETLSGDVTFATMEDWVEFTLRFHHSGAITIKGYMTSDMSRDAQLHFTFSIDQSYLPPLLKQIRNVLEHYSVVGNPNV